MTRRKANKILAKHAEQSLHKFDAFWSIHNDTQADARGEYRDQWTVHYKPGADNEYVSAMNVESLEAAIAEVLEKCKAVPAAVDAQLVGAA